MFEIPRQFLSITDPQTETGLIVFRTRKPAMRALMVFAGLIALIFSLVHWLVPIDGDLVKHVVFFLWFFLVAFSFFSDAAKSVSLTIDPATRRYTIKRTSLFGKKMLEGDLDLGTEVIVEQYSRKQLGGGSLNYVQAQIINSDSPWKVELARKPGTSPESAVTLDETNSRFVLELGEHWSHRLGLPLVTRL